MPLRLLHTSDWHLGRSHGSFPLLDDQRAVLEQIIGHCRASACDALLVSGDLFDRHQPSEEALRLWSQFLVSFRETCPRLPLLVIAGNHDSAARVAYASSALSLAGIHVRGGADDLERPVTITGADGERAQVWMAPFLWAGDLDAGGTRIRTQEETLAEAVARIRPGQEPGVLQVLMGHCFARGGAVSESERPLLGQATEVDAGLFSGFDYTALGHLHRGQRITDRVWYCGSPLPYSFSEWRNANGVLAVALAQGETPTVTRLALDIPRPLRKLEGTLEELLEDPRFQPDMACFVAATLRQVAAEANPFALLKRRFPFLVQVQYEGGEKGGSAEPAPTEAPGDLLADFRRFATGLRLTPEHLEAHVDLADSLIKELEPQVTK